ncbi:MAG: hypothetical protein ACYTHK_15940 [Planctomycetota bacterium]|jgi:tetratricopeptide (TPR) repeat protein
MVRLSVLLVFSGILLGCGLIAPSKTSEEDKELQEFAEARQRAATYYDGGEYTRAASQYKKALDIKPYHFMTQLGYAYSLTNTRYAPNIMLSIKFFNETMGRQGDPNKEVKRVFGLAEAYRLLAMFHGNRAQEREDNGLLDEAQVDAKESRSFSRSGIEAYEEVLVIDRKLESKSIASPFRASASLAPMARIGIAHCCIMLGNRENQAPLERAVEEVNIYAQTAANARKWWEQRREKVMEIDPLDSMVDGASQQMQSADDRRRYDEKIKATVEKEVLVRQALVITYMYIERYEEAIREASNILSLDDNQSQALFYRARCYSLLKPPQYERALEDMKEYRARQDLTRLTQEVIRINQLIRQYEARLREQKRDRELDAAGG